MPDTPATTAAWFITGCSTGLGLALAERVLPLLRAQGRGHVINVSSVGGIVGSESSGYYNASKFAVEGLSQALAQEAAPLDPPLHLVLGKNALERVRAKCGELLRTMDQREKVTLAAAFPEA